VDLWRRPEWLADWTQEDEARWRAEPERDYYAALGLPRSGSSPASGSRVRAAFHRLAVKWHPWNVWNRSQPLNDKNCTASCIREALVRFWTVTEAYLVMKDAERKRIYDECGLAALRKSESYYEEPLFEKDAFEVYDSFFSGEDPEDREFLLMNGGGQVEWSDDEGYASVSEHEDDNEDKLDFAREAMNAAQADASRTDCSNADVQRSSTGNIPGPAAAKAESELPPELLLPVTVNDNAAKVASGLGASLEARWVSRVGEACDRASEPMCAMVEACTASDPAGSQMVDGRGEGALCGSDGGRGIEESIFSSADTMGVSEALASPAKRRRLDVPPTMSSPAWSPASGAGAATAASAGVAVDDVGAVTTAATAVAY